MNGDLDFPFHRIGNQAAFLTRVILVYRNLIGVKFGTEWFLRLETGFELAFRREILAFDLGENGKSVTRIAPFNAITVGRFRVAFGDSVFYNANDLVSFSAHSGRK